MLNMQRIFLILAAVFGVLLVGTGLYFIDSPREARARRYDQARIQDLNALENAVNNYYLGNNQKMPATIAELNTYNQRAYNQDLNLKDPQSGASYEYRITGQNDGREFELCATFNVSDNTDQSTYLYGSNSWRHAAGRDCFIRTVTKPNVQD